MNIKKSELFYLAILSMLGFMATDMYLPAFKTLEDHFQTGPEPIALSLSIFLSGLAIGQILWGVASDRFGHRNTLIAGLTIFTLASIGISFSQEVWQLLILRLIQAFGVCAPSVIWQAMVISRHKNTSQQIFSTIMPLVALSPAIAPQLGVFMMSHFGWSSIFILLAVIGIILILKTMQIEQIKPEYQKKSVLKDIKDLLCSKAYLGNVLVFSMASAAFFAYLTAIPEIMAQMGYSEKDIGLSFIPQTIAFMLGGFIGKKFVEKFGDQKALKFLISLFSISAITLTFVTQIELSHIAPILTPFCFIAAANGAIYPIVVNRALSSAQKSPATAAGLQNSIQICISSLSSALVALFASQALKASGIAIFICCIGLLISYKIAQSKLKEENKAL